MKKILLATVAAIGFVGAASAADMRMPMKAAPMVAPVAAFNWSGCYIGGYVGGAWNAEDAKVTDVNGYSGAFDAWSYNTDSSFIGGGTLGCNWQPIGSPFVFGVEGEIGALSSDGSGYDPLFPALYSTTSYGDWYAMVTGRLGYAWDRAMVYVKGGAAFLTVDTTIVDTSIPATIATGSKDISTWTIGGGLEYAFDWNWSIKAEYMYIGLDDVSACTAPAAFCFNHDLEGIHTAKIGLNYRFGGGAPLMARY